jgi:predicted ATPase with chaperone activity
MRVDCVAGSSPALTVVTEQTRHALKVAQTIADPDHSDLIDTPNIAEALQYRKREGD